MTKHEYMTLRQHGLSDLHLDFFVFFSNQYFGPKIMNKGRSTQKHDSRVDLQNLNHRNARTSVDLIFNRFIFLTLNSTKKQENG